MYTTIRKTFRIAIGVSLILAMVLFAVSYFYSRETVFLGLNKDLGQVGDILFYYISYLAEGWIWIPYFMLLFGWYKKDALFILLNFLISTLLTQIPKNFIWNSVSRPMGSGISQDQFHRVEGVDMHLWNSFPSGHSASAATLFLFLATLSNKTFIHFICGIMMLLFGYSRIYLYMHFPEDVFVGLIIGIISMMISKYFLDRWIEKKSPTWIDKNLLKR